MTVRTKKAVVVSQEGLVDSVVAAKPPAKKTRSKPKKDTDGPVTVNAREMATKKFKEWWTVDELSAIISQINPDIIMMFSSDNKDVFNSDRLADILYDTIGTSFLRNIENSIVKRRLFLELVLETVIAKGKMKREEIIEGVRSVVRSKKKDSINTVADVVALEATNNLCLALAKMLGLPPSVAEKEFVETLPSTEIVIPHTQLNPLYDYQFTTGIMIRKMLEGTLIEHDKEIKRRMVSIPTGAGKTRMLVETIIEWLNDGKPSKNEQQRNSKFILWIAQSSELCEQAFSTFRTVFEDAGRRGTTLHIHRFWGIGGALPTLGMDDLLDERGVIVATIQSLFKILDQPWQLNTLGRLTACIIIDEAHHAVASSYSSVLRQMGFNWDNTKNEISEWGIILLGLTATPFRGKGLGTDTERLKRRLGGVHFPIIPYAEELQRYTPHAVVDCQTMAYTKDPVKILGEGSYDRDGFIAESDYYWTIKRKSKNTKMLPADAQKTDAGEEVEESDTPTWTYDGTKNIIHEFKKAGLYEVALSVKDNDGNVSTASAEIVIKTKAVEGKMTPEERQKNLYHRLIMRNILCDVYHKVLESDSYELSMQDMKHIANFGEFRGDTLKEIGRSRTRNTMIVQEIQKLRKLGMRKILFFGCSVAHSRQIAMLLKVLHGIKVRYVDSKMDLDSRVNAIEMFRTGDLEVLCNFDVLTTGFDAPNIDCVFVGRPIKSTLLYTQMIGRGMRGTKNGGTESMLLVDIDDNFQLRHGYGSQTVELGWKIFRDYWKTWEDPYENEKVDSDVQEAGPAGKWEEEDVWEEEEEEEFTYTCASCGAEADGIPDIQKTFGIEGADKLLAECLRSKNYDMLPTECQECRNK